MEKANLSSSPSERRKNNNKTRLDTLQYYKEMIARKVVYMYAYIGLCGGGERLQNLI